METFPLALYARTLSYLKASQILYLVLRRFRIAGDTPKRKPSVQVRQGVSMQPSLPTMTAWHGEQEFRFLNVSKTFSHGKVDWASTDMSKLWRYNLHYFDYALEGQRSAGDISRLISDWIENNPTGVGE